MGEQDRKWFPRWLASYASLQPCDRAEVISLDREMAICFLRDWRDRGKAAWQRLQTVRKIEFYRDQVLKSFYASVPTI